MQGEVAISFHNERRWRDEYISINIINVIVWDAINIAYLLFI